MFYYKTPISLLQLYYYNRCESFPCITYQNNLFFLHGAVFVGKLVKYTENSF